MNYVPIKRLELLEEILRENGLDLESARRSARREERTGEHAAWLEELRPKTLGQLISEKQRSV